MSVTSVTSSGDARACIASKSVVRVHFPRNRRRLQRLKPQDKERSSYQAKKANTAKKRIQRRVRGRPGFRRSRGLGPESAGQSGDLRKDSLTSRARDFRKRRGIDRRRPGPQKPTPSPASEDAPDADTREVHVHERSEDDVPEEYKDQD